MEIYQKRPGFAWVLIFVLISVSCLRFVEDIRYEKRKATRAGGKKWRILLVKFFLLIEDDG